MIADRYFSMTVRTFHYISPLNQHYILYCSKWADLFQYAASVLFMSNSALYTEKRTCILASAFAYVRLFAFRAAHSQLEVLLMGEDLVTIGVGLGLLGFLHNEAEYHHIDCQCQYGDYALRCGVGSGGVHRRVHKPVSIHTGDHGELALILEQREHLGSV